MRSALEPGQPLAAERHRTQPLGIANRKLQSDPRTHRVADHMGFLDLEVIEKANGVAYHL